MKGGCAAGAPLRIASEWNSGTCSAGWKDYGLTSKGSEEANMPGRRLKQLSDRASSFDHRLHLWSVRVAARPRVSIIRAPPPLAQESSGSPSMLDQGCSSKCAYLLWRAVLSGSPPGPEDLTAYIMWCVGLLLVHLFGPPLPTIVAASQPARREQRSLAKDPFGARRLALLPARRHTAA